MKNDDEIIEDLPWIMPFIDVWTMHISQKIVILKKKNDENIL